MKRIALAALLLAAAAGAARAQAAPAPGSLSNLTAWLGTQQAELGTSFGFQKAAGKPVLYGSTYWDAVSLGSSGINVGAASALDFMDLGLGVAAANAEKTRYGIFVPLHIGNAWNSVSSHLPAKIADHVYMIALPNVTVAIAAYEPTNGVLKSWTIKNDGQLSVAYRFGGAPTTTTGAIVPASARP